MNKTLIAFLISILLIGSNAYAGTDGENSLSKKNTKDTKDCFEGLNRGIFAFNEGLDKAIFKPIAKTYLKLPSEIRTGTGNVINNLSNLLTIPNNLLQGELLSAGLNSARLGINTTIGLLGIFDVASKLGLESNGKEDYGQTLGLWGVGPGCYVVLPVLGPSTLRDAIGNFASLSVGIDPWYNITVNKDTQHFSDFDYYGSRATKALDFRAKNLNSIDNLEKNSMDFYASVKSLYLQDRYQKIVNSKDSTNTQIDEDWEEIESQ